MIAQTYPQWFRQLLQANRNADDLLRARHAYELALQLFASQVRPNGKPFVCHLTGVASCLLHWGESTEMVLAGLLHSAYLYGEFGDGQSRNAPRRRAYVRGLVGERAEGLIDAYTRAKATPLPDQQDRDVQVLYLADLVEELSDAGPLFAARKPIPELPGFPQMDSADVQKLMVLLDRHVGSKATAMLQAALDQCRESQIPPGLVRDFARSYKVQAGVAPLRGTKIQQLWRRSARRWSRRSAA